MRTPISILLLLIAFNLAGVVVESPAAAAKRDSDVDHVVIISIDGLNSLRLRDALQFTEMDQFPAFRRILSEGASTLNARTDYHFTNTLPNHTCIVTGRPTLQPEGGPAMLPHGWTGNDTPLRSQTLHASTETPSTYIASVFDVVHDHGMSTSLYASKRKFILYEQSYNERSGAADSIEPNHGRDKIDRFAIDASSGSPATAKPLWDTFIREFADQRFTLSFVHIRDTDSTGHKYGWASSEWRGTLANVDGYLDELLELIDGDAALQSRTAIILTSDHGGRDSAHSNEAEPLNFTIPFMVWGPGVAAGADLYELNSDTRLEPSRSGPGSRPSYAADPQPIRNGDAGNLALHLLGLPAIPGSSLNAEQDLKVR